MAKKKSPQAKAAAKKKATVSSLKSTLKAKGFRLPHGYEVVRRKSK